MLQMGIFNKLARNPAEKLLNNYKHKHDDIKSKKSSLRPSPHKSVKTLRSTSPPSKFCLQDAETPMDMYKIKRFQKKIHKHNSKIVSQLKQQNDSIDDASKANIVRPSISRIKYGSQPNLHTEDHKEHHKVEEYLTNSHDSNCSVEDRLLNKQKEYDERRKSKREETQEVQFKECTFTPSLKKKTVAQHSQADINDMKKKLQASAYDVLLREESKSSQISLDQTRTDHKESQPRQEVEISQISGISNTKESFSNHPEEKFQEQPSAQKPLSHTSDFPAEDPEEDRYDEEAKELGSYLQENSLEEVHKDENVDLTPQKNAFSPDDVQSGTDNEPLELPRTTPEQEYSHEYEEEEDSEENYPILFLDVNLGKDKVERLVIFDGDDPQTVAEEFCQKNGLEEKKRKKLAKVIKKQLDSLLTRIDEDEDEEESRD